jgi:hypothetical protein
MTRTCRSNHRCSQITCETCCWRYCLGMTRRILSTATGGFYSIKLTIPGLAPDGFRDWRVQARNFLDYQRRRSRFWKSVGLHLWLAQDGKLNGIISLGLLGPSEVISTFISRWSPTIRPIAPEEVRQELYAVARPSVVSTFSPGRGRYQPRKFSVWPCWRSRPSASAQARRYQQSMEPMPVIF